MKLIVAEKPSMMHSIKDAIESSGVTMMRGQSFNQGDEYYLSPEYCITSCFGHLFTMCEPGEYDKKWEKWKIDTLPFAPDNFLFRHKIKDDIGIKNRFSLICKLVERSDIDCVVGAGDADAEGQRIGDLVLGQALRITKQKKAFLRLWVNDLTPNTILKGLNNLKPNSDYKNYYLESATREAYDFLFGINYTRFCSCKYGEVLHIGRVSGCIIKTIAERDDMINKFQPVDYYVLESKVETNGFMFELLSKKYDTRKNCSLDELNYFKEKYNKEQGLVTSVKKKDKSIVAAPRMFTMASLQNYMSENFSWNMNRTNIALQNLYEAGYSSYPRTEADTFRDEEFDYVQYIIDSVNSKKKSDIVKNKRDTRIYDSSRVTSHSCISITDIIPNASALKYDEKTLYDVLYNRFCAVFCKEICHSSKIEIQIAVGEESWIKKGETITQLGWQKYEKPKNSAVSIPDFNVGDCINVDFKTVKKTTIPPKHLTVSSLNNFLLSPFKKKKKTDDEEEEILQEELSQEDMKLIKEGCQIGTAATREPLIKQAKDRGYFFEKGQSYYITEKGLTFLNIVEQLGIDVSPKNTALMGKELMNVANGKRTMVSFLEEEYKKISNTIEASKNLETVKAKPATSYNSNQKYICKCPRCNGDVLDTPKAYSCNNNDFVIFKDSKIIDFFAKTDTPFTIDLLKEFCINGKAKICHVPSSKKVDSNGNPFYYDAFFSLSFEEGKNYPIFKMIPNAAFSSQNMTPFTKCPKCKKNIFKNSYGWFCESNDLKLFRENKYFILVAKRNMDDDDARNFLEQGFLELELKNEKGFTQKKKMLMTFDDDIYPKFQMEKKEEALPFNYDKMSDEELLKYKVGDCKKCGGMIVRTNFGYQCVNKDFKLAYDNFFTRNVKKTPLTQYEGDQLIIKGEVITNFVSKEGKNYRAKIVMSIDTEHPESLYPLLTKEYVEISYKNKGNQYGGNKTFTKKGEDMFGASDGYNKKGNVE